MTRCAVTILLVVFACVLAAIAQQKFSSAFHNERLKILVLPD
jgi:hypothetical protein